MVELIVVALGVARLTLIAVKDDISEPVRNLIWYISPPQDDEASGQYYQSYRRATREERREQRKSGLGIIESRYVWGGKMPQRRGAGFWGRVITCPDCLGVWIAAPTAIAFYAAPTATFYVALPFALSMVTSLIARRY